MNIIIFGVPRSGKTTTANKIGEFKHTPVLHTDDLMKLEWSSASEEASHWFDREGPWIIEGVMAVRALRKWLKRNPGKKLKAIVFFFGHPLVELTKGQETMAKSCGAIYDEIGRDLCLRGMTHASCGKSPENLLKPFGLLPMEPGDSRVAEILDVIVKE